MRGTRRMLSRSNSRALTLLFFLFFLEKPRGRIKPSLKKKDRQRSRKDRRFSSSSSSFFSAEEDEKEGRGGCEEKLALRTIVWKEKRSSRRSYFNNEGRPPPLWPRSLFFLSLPPRRQACEHRAITRAIISPLCVWNDRTEGMID